MDQSFNIIDHKSSDIIDRKSIILLNYNIEELLVENENELEMAHVNIKQDQANFGVNSTLEFVGDEELYLPNEAKNKKFKNIKQNIIEVNNCIDLTGVKDTEEV